MAQRFARQPRIRKTAPTVREMAEKAKAPSIPKKTRVSGSARRVLSKLRLPHNRLTKPLFWIARQVRRFLGWIIPSYFIHSWREVRLVTWPSRRETWRLTSAVFIFAIIFGVMVGIVDKALDEIFKKLILK